MPAMRKPFVRPNAVIIAGLAWLLACPMAWPASGGKAPPKPYMMYFYNPSCRLCTRTNEVVGAIERKYESVMGHQRLNIADSETGADSVLYMFDLLDELKVPDDGTITLVVYLGLLDADVSDQPVFLPKRVLIEGDSIIANLEKEAADFLAATARRRFFPVMPWLPPRRKEQRSRQSIRARDRGARAGAAPPGPRPDSVSAR